MTRTESPVQVVAKRSFAVLATLILLAGCGDGELTDADFVERALARQQAGETSAAIVELKNAVQRNPENARARSLLGELYVDSGAAAAGEKELSRAIELGVDDRRLEARLARARLMQGKYRAVIDSVPGDVDASDDVGADLAVYRGFALLGLPDLDEAESTFESLLRQSEHPWAYAGLARVALARDDAEAAAAPLARGLEKFPESGELNMVDGERLMRAGDPAAAEAAYERAIAAGEGREETARLGIARAQLARGENAEAKATLAELPDSARNSLQARTLRGYASLRTEEWPAAREDAEAILSADSNNPAGLYIAGAAAFAQGQDEQAKRFLRSYIAAAPNDGRGRRMLATLQHRGGNSAEAYRTLAEAPAALRENPVYLASLSTAALLAGEKDDGVRYIEEAVALAPDDAALRERLTAVRASALSGTEQTSLNGNLATGGNPVDPAVQAIVDLIRGERFAEALERIEELKEKDPDAPAVDSLSGVAHFGLGDLEAAKAAFRAALRAQPANLGAANNLVSVLAREENWEEARQVYLDLLEQRPGDAQVQERLAAVERRAGRPEDTIERLEKAVQEDPEATEPAILLARAHLTAGRHPEAVKALARFDDETSDDPALLETLGLAQVGLEKFPEATETFRKLVRARPDAVVAHSYLASALRRADRPEEALEAVEAGLQVEPENRPLRLEQARLLTSTGSPAAALPILSGLAEEVPDDPAVAEQRGAAALGAGRPEEAVDAFRDALRLRPNNVNATRLAAAQVQAGQRDEAKSTLAGWLQDYPDDAASHQFVAGLHMEDGEIAQAREHYEALLRQSESSVVANNNLAWIHLTEGNAEDALRHAEKAHAAAPESPQVLDTLGLVLMRRGDHERALEMLEKAAALLPEDATVQVNYAKALIARDQVDRASAVLDSVLGMNAPDEVSNEARQLLVGIRG